MGNDIVLKSTSLKTGYYNKNKVKTVIGDFKNLTLEKGDFIALLGPNGVGKSTLLKTLSGELLPISGSIIIDNRNILDYSNIEKSKVLSFVFSNVQIVGNLSVKETVMMGRYPYVNWWGKLSPKDDALVIQALEDVGAIHLIERKITQLSDGERQKVMIARAIAQDTPLILLDEPTAHLDLINRIEIFQLLKRIARKHQKSILLSTHEVEMSLQIADKMWILENGKCTIGTPDAIISEGEIERVFSNKNIGFDTNQGTFNYCADKTLFSYNISIDSNVEITEETRLRISWVEKKFLSEGCVRSDTPDFIIHLILDNNSKNLVWDISYLNTNKRCEMDGLDLFKTILKLYTR
ncbi:ABC transporter ATP-binding protein [Flammeovirga kamogawensis]|uniref:ABC transporter ATP-binding protein n=1 Tax=Flammeovirga kamogawensis TaxID=373891 RepID=A0ABX8GWX2_9BACT|nr:ABC transporter ATP-binding protein [Flammeovirga kamogawensis]MBB6461277.1 iron complex transport system ATP-binding protein [Flammeovirga kamogawensis]QWG07836.1 ABC transporter ATP-binding protein [Flammeovirga kamogawensis]TRX69641.1 ABC transporter ATP-binding protein [Flammeovirga kamogawensis]